MAGALASLFVLLVFANPLHHVGWRPLVVELVFHKIHVGSHMLEKAVIPGTQVVQPRLTGSGAGKPVFGTLAVAGKQVVARFALGRQAVALFIISMSDLE